MRCLARIDRMGRSLLTWNRDRECKTLKQMPALRPKDHVLDVGSGDGFWTARFSLECARITGLEPDEHALEYARALYQRPNVEYVQCNAECLPYLPSQDCCYSPRFLSRDSATCHGCSCATTVDNNTSRGSATRKPVRLW
jgi:SAM-dependent methyltransferase